MIKPEDVIKAKKILNISEEASLNEIKLSYRNLLKRWHPDKQPENHKICAEKTREIVWAYNVVVEYCRGYKFSFSDNEIRKQLKGSSFNWWMERFGEDPLWGRDNK